jgi:hypothetical protein
MHDRLNLIDRLFKDSHIRLGWFGRSADLSNKLERGRPDLLISRWRIEIEKGPNIPAHGSQAYRRMPPQVKARLRL